MAFFSTRTLAAGAALLLIFGLGPKAASQSQAGAERGVRRALIRLNGFLANRDLAVVDEFARGPETRLVGSAPSDVARTREDLETHFARYFAMPETLAFSWREVQVSVHGAIAWLHAEGELVLNGPAGAQRRPYRLTGVLELQGGLWKWRLFHGSEPAAEAA
jgi:ketosteroid isomerase-like protein